MDRIRYEHRPKWCRRLGQRNMFALAAFGLLQVTRQMHISLSDSIADRPDMQNAIRRPMRPDDMLETFSELAVKKPHLTRPTFQDSVAALVPSAMMALTRLFATVVPPIRFIESDISQVYLHFGIESQLIGVDMEFQ